MDSIKDFKEYRFADIMLENTPTGVAILDTHELRLLEANASYFRHIRSLSENIHLTPGTSLFEFEQYEDTRKLLEICRRVIETGIAGRAEEVVYESLTRGTTYWNWAITPIFDKEHTVTRIVLTLNDVTSQVLARRQAEEAQQQLRSANAIVEEERQRLAIVEAIAHCVRETLDPVRIGQITMDMISSNFDTITACIHAANPAQSAFKLLCAYRSHTCDVDELNTMNYIPYERLTLTRGMLTQREPIVVEDIQAAAEAGLVAKQNPIVRSGVRGYISVPLWFGDQLEGTLVASFRPVVSRDGPEVRALVGMGTHVAAALAHARLHNTIETERTRLRAILDQLPEGILIAETSGGAISYANPAAAQILGISTEEIAAIPLHRHTWLRTRIETTIDGRPLPPWNFLAIRALSGETLTGKETLVIRPDGTRVVTLASCAPLYTERGLMSGAVIVLQDVTEQKTLEQQKSDFFSIANHELRTPITVIQGFAEILQLKASQEQHLDDLTLYALTNITEQSQHLTHLIEEMLDISRIEQTQFTLHCTDCDLLAILNRVVDNQSRVTRHRHFRFLLEGMQPSEALPAYLDEHRMEQVFNNLIDNAIKYSSTDSTIEIGLRMLCDKVPERPQEVLIWVKDEGIGIAAEDIPHIFKRFHRARNVDRSHSGFGIGLYLVKEVITRHKGRVRVESSEGKGSTFYITLPLSKPDHL